MDNINLQRNEEKESHGTDKDRRLNVESNHNLFPCLISIHYIQVTSLAEIRPPRLVINNGGGKRDKTGKGTISECVSDNCLLGSRSDIDEYTIGKD